MTTFTRKSNELTNEVWSVKSFAILRLSHDYFSLTLNKTDIYEQKVTRIQKNFNHINPISNCFRDSRNIFDSASLKYNETESRQSTPVPRCAIFEIFSQHSGVGYSCSVCFSFSAFATSLWELQKHFPDDKDALTKIIHCLQEMNKFHNM